MSKLLKVDKRKVIQEALAEKTERRNITFSLPDSLLNQFKKECEKHDLKMNKVLEKMIEQFLGSGDK